MFQALPLAASPRCRELCLETTPAEMEELRSRLAAACAALGLLLEGYHAMNVNWLASLPGWLEQHVVPSLHENDMEKAVGALALADQLRAATDSAQLALDLSWPHLKQFAEAPDTEADAFVTVPRPPDV
jgi:hypothetical protein